jgi:hypothetical protein
MSFRFKGPGALFDSKEQQQHSKLALHLWMLQFRECLYSNVSSNPKWAQEMLSAFLKAVVRIAKGAEERELAVRREVILVLVLVVRIRRKGMPAASPVSLCCGLGKRNLSVLIWAFIPLSCYPADRSTEIPSFLCSPGTSCFVLSSLFLPEIPHFHAAVHFWENHVMQHLIHTCGAFIRRTVIEFSITYSLIHA